MFSFLSIFNLYLTRNYPIEIFFNGKQVKSGINIHKKNTGAFRQLG